MLHALWRAATGQGLPLLCMPRHCCTVSNRLRFVFVYDILLPLLCRRYVIDFYNAAPRSDMPAAMHLDVRPALDSPG
jgi:hypothetical protein